MGRESGKSQKENGAKMPVVGGGGGGDRRYRASLVFSGGDWREGKKADSWTGWPRPRGYRGRGATAAAGGKTRTSVSELYVNAGITAGFIQSNFLTRVKSGIIALSICSSHIPCPC